MFLFFCLVAYVGCHCVSSCPTDSRETTPVKPFQLVIFEFFQFRLIHNIKFSLIKLFNYLLYQIFIK